MSAGEGVPSSVCLPAVSPGPPGPEAAEGSQGPVGAAPPERSVESGRT